VSEKEVAIFWRAPLASVAFPVPHSNKQIPETAFSREQNSILTVTEVALMIFFLFKPSGLSLEVREL
jgi:hypothetical protein